MSIFSRWQAAQEPAPSEDHVIYLIDTENVKSVWTALLENMTDSDKVYLFYTMNSGSVSYEALTGILQSGKHVELMECFTGKNGLDFQLVSYLGYMIHENDKADYCIVSDDGGYDAAIKFWQKRDVKVSRKTASQVSGKPAKTSKFRNAKPQRRTVKKTVTRKAEIEPQTEAEALQAAIREMREAGLVAPGVEKKPFGRGKSQVSAPDIMTAEGSPVAMESIAETSRTLQETAKAGTVISVSALAQVLPEETPEHLQAIAGLLEKAGRADNLADIHDGIEKIYRDDRSSEVYRTLRPHLKELYQG